jgi:integrase
MKKDTEFNIKPKRRAKGSGRLYKRGKNYYADFKVKGGKQQIRLLDDNGDPITDKKQAEAKLESMRQTLGIEDHEKLVQFVADLKHIGRDILIDDIWNVFLKSSSRPDSGKVTLEGYKKHLKYFTDYIKSNYPNIINISQITKQIVNDFFYWYWNTRNVSGIYYNKICYSLRLIFKHIGHVSLVNDSIFEDIARKNVDLSSRQNFTNNQIAKIFKAFDDGFFYETEVEVLTEGRERIRKKVIKEYIPKDKEQLKVVMSLCCWTGCRGQDACLMTWDQINFEDSTITFIPNKTQRKTKGKSVSLPLHPDLLSCLLEAKQWKCNDFICPNMAKRYKYNPGGIEQAAIKIFRIVLKVETKHTEGHRRIAANRYSLHSFRHTLTSWLVNAGVPDVTIRSIVGHSSARMTETYTHTSKAALNDAMSNLPMLEDHEKENIISKIIDCLHSCDIKTLKRLLKIAENNNHG